jgi:glycosyltransferase involved in cell wall biosynthesis
MNPNNHRHLVVIRNSDLHRDIRVPKEIEVLSNGYKITFLGWNREGKENDFPNFKGCYDVVFFNFKATYGKNILKILPIWWIFIFFKLIFINFDILHVFNLDSVFPAILVAKIKNKKIIYEVLDTYEDQIILNKSIRKIIILIDKLFLYCSDAVILADEAQIAEFEGIPNKKILPIYDSPPDILRFLKKNKIKNKNFVLFYAGILFKDRSLNIERVIEAINDIEGIKLIIAGDGDLVSTIKNYEELFPGKIKYIGRIDYITSLKNYYTSDCAFVLRDPAIPINKYICGSTLLNAMMCGKPILVNNGTSTADKVVEENCGLVVDANNITEIRDAIVMLRDDPELRMKLGANGRRAYEERYSWEIMEQRLITLYQELTGLRER